MVDGCYHGAVDESFVRVVDGRTVHRPGLIGQAEDLTRHSVAIEFNDVTALEQALARGDIAAVLCEPAMTNVGMVLPDPGFHDALRRLTRANGTLLIIDETHTISTGPGGCTAEYGLEPDMLVPGKPIAGGIPAGVYGDRRSFRALVSHQDGVAPRIPVLRGPAENGTRGRVRL